MDPKDDMDRVYMSRKEKGRLTNIKDGIDTSIWRLEDLIKNED